LDYRYSKNLFRLKLKLFNRAHKTKLWAYFIKRRREGGAVERLHAKFHLNVFIVSASGSQIPQLWANIDIWGTPIPTTLLTRAKFSALEQTYSVRLHATFRLDQFISVALRRRKTPIFPIFWTSAFSGVDSWRNSEKVEHGAQPQTLPYPTASKQFQYSNAFVAKSSAQTLTFKLLYLFVLLFCASCLVNKDVYKSEEQTNRQTKKLNIFGRPGGG